MRFTPIGPDTSIEQTKARLANYQEHQTEQGFRSGSSWIVTCAVRLGIRHCSRCKNTVGSTWASASACSRSIAVDGTGSIMFTENGKQDCGHAWNPESTFVSPALPLRTGRPHRRRIQSRSHYVRFQAFVSSQYPGLHF